MILHLVHFHNHEKVRYGFILGIDAIQHPPRRQDSYQQAMSLHSIEHLHKSPRREDSYHTAMAVQSKNVITGKNEGHKCEIQFALK